MGGLQCFSYSNNRVIVDIECLATSAINKKSIHKPIQTLIKFVQVQYKPACL